MLDREDRRHFCRLVWGVCSVALLTVIALRLLLAACGLWPATRGAP